MATMRHVLLHKGHKVYNVPPDAPVIEALRLMAAHNVGGLVVSDDATHLVGIVTERDYARKIILKGRTSPDTPVREIMSTAVIYARPDQTVEAVHGDHDVKGRTKCFLCSSIRSSLALYRSAIW